MQKINFLIVELNPADTFDFGKPYDMPDISYELLNDFNCEWEVELK